MPACCVSYCNNRTEKGIRLFMLPQGDRNKERRDAWIKNIKREDLSSKAHVCEAHFEYDQFENHREDGKRTLKNNALPTLFSVEHSQLNENTANATRRSTRKRKPVYFEEYHSGDEDIEDSKSDGIKIEVEQSSDKKTVEPIKKNNVQLIRCRTCLSTTPKEFSHVLKKMMLGRPIKEVILICVPQMELLDDEYICEKCYKFLFKLMLFIDNCLDSEEQLAIGKISLEVDSNDIADINKTAHQPLSKKRGRPRKYPIAIKENNDRDYEPGSTSDKIPKKRGRKPKIDIKSEADKEDENTEGVRWGIPNTEDKTIVVRKYGKTKTSVDQPGTDDGSPMVASNPIGEPNYSSEPIENIEIHDETEMFIEHKQDNMLSETTEQTDLTSNDTVIEEMPLKDSEIISKHILADHSYVPEDLKQLLRCPHCMTDYRTLRGIKSHLFAAHKIAEEQSFKCSLCNMKFIRYKDMVKHKTIHGYSCELCEHFFTTSAELESHRSAHPEKYCCVKCGEKFKKKTSLEKHIPLHQMMSRIRTLIKSMGKSVLQCPHCNLKCSYASALQQHINSVHLKIKDFECGACNKKFSTSNSLKVHVRVRHSKDTPYVCQECGVSYERLDYLKKHEHIHFENHNPFINPAKRNYSKVSNNTDTTFACMFCSVKEPSKEQFLVHLQTHKGLKRYECDYCGLILSCQRTKLTHESTHKNANFEYLCIACRKKFSTKQEFITHEDSRECVSKKFTCNICNFTYSRQILLETHILNEHVENTKNEIKPFDKGSSDAKLEEVIRRNIEIEWGTDEEEEELANHHSSEEEINATELINSKKENTDTEKLKEEHTDGEEYILGMDEDPVIEAAIENSNFHTQKEIPDKTENMVSQTDQKVDSNQDINTEDLELEEEKEYVVIVEENTKQISLHAVTKNNHGCKENKNSINEQNSTQIDNNSIEEHSKENKQSENESLKNIVIKFED